MYRVLKFGGSSVASPERIKHIINILKKYYSERKGLVLVFSAFGGITDVLLDLCKKASEGDISYLHLFETYKNRHDIAIDELFGKEDGGEIKETIRVNHETLHDLLHGIFLIREVSARTSDLVLSFGERNANAIIAAAFSAEGIPSVFTDSRNLITTNSDFGQAKVIFEKTNKQIRNYISGLDGKIPVITGFIGSDEHGLTTTLGRGGSDYTASIFAAALDAEELEIWTDVDGVLTADPRKVKKAFTLHHLSYAEAMEMSHFGAKVIYPPTILPACQKSVPIRIKNTFNPSFAGTLITKNVISSDKSPIKGISSLNNISLINLQGSGLMGIPGIAARLFSVLGREKVNIILITQASSEYSISLAVESKDHYKALQAIQEEFVKEILDGSIFPVIAESDLCVVAVIGEQMRHVPGISGKLFNALGKNGINVMAIAQGSSELNISFVVHKKDEIKTLNAIHDSFFLSDVKRVHLFIVGTGLIGSTLLKQIEQQKTFLHDELHLDIIVAGLANSKKMILDENGINISHWQHILEKNGTDTNMEVFIREMKENNLPNSIFIDNTASKYIPSFYHIILSGNVSVCTPNKVAASSPLAEYKALKRLAKDKMIHLLFETNVGAGLPVLSTMRNLILSGDTLLKIEGVLSGSLSYIFNTYEAGQSFTDLVYQAKELGYTEPDPRDDLSGMDVKRKIMILAREGGFDVEEEDVIIEPILSADCMSAPDIDGFFDSLKKEEGIISDLAASAKKENKYLRYLASFEKGKIHISLQKVDHNSPFVSLAGSDNMIVFTTERYKERPLVIKGPGAGAEVTAAGLFAEIIAAGQ
jgi:aspartokinase/homoserine dehydrogenase 1